VRAKSKNRKKARDYSKFIPILTLISGIIAGNLWPWKQADINRANYELDKTSKIIEIRNNIDTNIIKLLALYKKHTELTRELSKNYSEDNRERISRETDNIWKYEYPSIESNIKQLEAVLSKLENRDPRMFNFPLPPLTGLKISIQ